MPITTTDMSTFLDTYTLNNRVIAIHSAFSALSNGHQGNAISPLQLLELFLDRGNTILVPTHSWDFLTPPDKMHRPLRNAWDYDSLWNYKSMPPFTPETKVIDSDMGTFSKTVLNHPNAVRGNNALCSFTAVGPLAQEVCGSQTNLDVSAPLRELVAHSGIILCIGVPLTKLTLIHYAEECIGGKPFLRWVESSDHKTVPVSVGGCSEGFQALSPILKKETIEVTLGSAQTLIIDAAPALTSLTQGLKTQQGITQCSDHCPVCKDRIAGGPLY
ncbi:MAG: AAC(3) family N-acetyltransferase [Fibrobacterales bacterium]